MGYINKIIQIKENYDINGAIELALTQSGSKAAYIAANHGRYDEAIQLAGDDNYHKAEIAEQFHRYENATYFWEKSAIELLDDVVRTNQRDRFHVEDEDTIHFNQTIMYRLLGAARNAGRAGLKSVEDRLYGYLIRANIENQNLKEAENIAFEAERWKDFAKIRLEAGHEKFADVYESILDGSHTMKKGLLENALEESKNEAYFSTAALIATYLGKEKQSTDFKYLGNIVSN